MSIVLPFESNLSQMINFEVPEFGVYGTHIRLQNTVSDNLDFSNYEKIVSYMRNNCKSFTTDNCEHYRR